MEVFDQETNFHTGTPSSFFFIYIAEETQTYFHVDDVQNNMLAAAKLIPENEFCTCILEETGDVHE